MFKVPLLISQNSAVVMVVMPVPNTFNVSIRCLVQASELGLLKDEVI